MGVFLIISGVILTVIGFKNVIGWALLANEKSVNFPDKNKILAVGTALGILSCILGGTLVNTYNTNAPKAIEYKEVCIKQKSNIDITASNLLKSADTILTFTNKNTDTYEELMEAIAAARNNDYSSADVDKVYSIIHENYPTDMEIGKQWSTYTAEVDKAYSAILCSQIAYNEAVLNYKTIFRDPFKKLALFGIINEDRTIDYYQLSYTIDYEITNK